jgi:glyoxylase-like metal-dependent hydrolase (beta-lactamase superfamily II)
VSPKGLRSRFQLQEIIGVMRIRRDQRQERLMIELVTTDGIFALDGGEWEVTNNIWPVGDDREVVVIDAAHDHRPIVDAVAGRRVTAIALTHGHNDHINAAIDLTDAVDAPVWLHPDDRMLWDAVHPGRAPDLDLASGTVLQAGDAELAVLQTPGHSPGCCCFHLAGGGDVVFTGDTLFCGGPGATGRSFSDFPTIVESIRRRLLSLPPETVVHTGHGESTTIGAEAPHLQEWIDRGH